MPEALNRCPHTQTTPRNIPIEIWDVLVTTGKRVATAPFHTCATCGAGFYRPEVLAQTGVPIAPPGASPAPDNWDC